MGWSIGFDDWLLPNRMKRGWGLSTREYARLVDKWVGGSRPGRYGTHSLRRTKVALLYKKTGNLRACHSSWLFEAGEHCQIHWHRSGRRPRALGGARVVS